MAYSKRNMIYMRKHVLSDNYRKYYCHQHNTKHHQVCDGTKNVSQSKNYCCFSFKFSVPAVVAAEAEAAAADRLLKYLDTKNLTKRKR